MKSQEKVKRQRRIKSIPNYCDNPMSKESKILQDLFYRGLLKIEKPQPIRVDHSQKRHMLKRANRISI